MENDSKQTAQVQSVYPGLTRSEDTTIKYRNLGESIAKRYQNEMRETWHDGPTRFVRWVIAQRPDWSASYWRLVKQGVREYLIGNGAPHEAIALMDDDELLAQFPSKKKQRPTTREGREDEAGKKRIRNQDLEAYLSALGRSRSSLANTASIYLVANQEVGLRPSEWGTAYVDGNRLYVRNAKNSNGRATGEYRYIDMDDRVQRLIDLMIRERDSLLATYYGTWEKAQKALQKFLKDFRRRNKLPRIVMYSTRHQFAADKKRAGMSKRDLADLMGHRSDKTASMHYGKARSGKGDGTGVTPVPNHMIEQSPAQSPQRNEAGTADPSASD